MRLRSLAEQLGPDSNRVLGSNLRGRSSALTAVNLVVYGDMGPLLLQYGSEKANRLCADCCDMTCLLQHHACLSVRGSASATRFSC